MAAPGLASQLRVVRIPRKGLHEDAWDAGRVLAVGALRAVVGAAHACGPRGGRGRPCVCDRLRGAGRVELRAWLAACEPTRPP